MKIPRSVRDLYDDLEPTYVQLQKSVNDLIVSKKERRWHYEERLKDRESFALKPETGRVKDPHMLEDFFACTLVVENHGRIPAAERFICELFDIDERRPKKADLTRLAPYSFDFDDLRLDVKWKDDPAQRPTGLHGRVFEVQVKTFLQHAWGIATHVFVYKTDDVDWATSRIAFQVKAMLENAELSIAEARRLTDTSLLNRSDKDCQQLRRTIEEIKVRWKPEQLPKDLRRLAQNILDMSWLLKLQMPDVWTALDEASAVGEGAETLNLSPYSAIVSALVRKRGPGLFKPLGNVDSRRGLFVPLEVDLPALPASVSEHVIRPV